MTTPPATTPATRVDTGIRIRYEQHGISSFDARVYLNDIDISAGLRHLKLEVTSGELTVAELSIVPDKVEIDARTIAVLTAIVEQEDAP